MAARSMLSTLSRCHFDLDQVSEAVDGPRYDIRKRRSFITTIVALWIELVKIRIHVNKVSACYWMCSGVFLPVTCKVRMQY